MTHPEGDAILRAPGGREAPSPASRPLEDLEEWLALLFVPGLRPGTVKRLLTRFGSPGAARRASLAEILSDEGVHEKEARALAGFDDWARVRKEAGEIRRRGIAMLVLDDPAYPDTLRQIYDPPPVLYMSGEIRPEDDPAIAIVGARKASGYGRSVARCLAAGLSRKGVTVVSGLARGIDSEAHEATLEAGGRTIAVLGCGLDTPYPAGSGPLKDGIAASGAVVTEFPLGTPPLKENFPARNRVISGLARGVAVVEARERSGSLITARWALEHGREVYAVPGDVGSPLSRGTHRLIRQGAKLVETAADIVEDLDPWLQDGRTGAAGGEGASPAAPGIEGEADRRLYGTLGFAPLSAEEILSRSGVAPAEAMAALLRLEVLGLARRDLSGGYARVGPPETEGTEG